MGSAFIIVLQKVNKQVEVKIRNFKGSKNKKSYVENEGMAKSFETSKVYRCYL